jgi:uncharacterized membrane-anchored protein YhcB (DUF1043 family)
MTCAEFQRELPEYMEGSAPELKVHLQGCPNCSGLVACLESIVREAHELQASEEPSPRVWNSIEIALRKENLIRTPRPANSLLPPFLQRWGAMAWAVPVAAVFLVGVAITLYQRPSTPGGTSQQAVLATPATNARFTADSSDEQLLQEVSQRAPLMRAAYERNLQDVNDYIRDAQASVNADPNDEEARQALMDAYGQKSMIYEMALDRSLP